MSRVRKSSVYMHFEEENGAYKCIIEYGDKICGKIIPINTSGGGSTGMLKRHLKQCHDKEYVDIEKKDMPASKKVATAQKPLTEFLPRLCRKASITISKDDFVASILKMICYDSVALTFFQGSGFQLLNGPLAANLGVSLNRDSLRELVISKASEQKRVLAECIGDSFFSIKFDGVSRLRTHFLGISIQFWTPSEGLTIKYLALVDTDGKSDSATTKALVRDVLSQYGLNINKVFACIVDNAANMTRTIELLNEDAGMHDDGTETEDPLALDFSDFGPSISHLRCVEHTLQLGVRDGLKKSSVNNFIEKVRKLAVNLRSPRNDAVLKRCAGKGMLIDMPTRWGSTFLMVSRLLELKDAILELSLSEVHFSDYEWVELARLVDILRVPYDATLQFQSENLTPGQCYLDWKQVVFKLDKIGGTIAAKMSEALKSREEALLQSEAFVAAIWIDSRSRVLLSEFHKITAKSFLKSLYLRLSQFTPPSDSSSTPIASSSTETPISSDFDSYLDGLEPSTSTYQPNPELDVFESALTAVEKLGRVKRSEVWEILSLYPDVIQPVARVVSALPCTQVSVERMLSHLRLVLRDNRAKMGANLADAILFLKMNKRA